MLYIGLKVFGSKKMEGEYRITMELKKEETMEDVEE
jgi:hypothetical protein